MKKVYLLFAFLVFFATIIVLPLFGYNGKKSTIIWGCPKNIAMLPILAQVKGFFAKEGLNAQRQDIQTGKMAMDGLINGSIDFGVLVETNIAFIKFQPGVDLKIICIISEKFDDAIMARKDHGITNPKDLEGKRLGLTYATTSHAFAIQYLMAKGVDLSEVTIVNMPPPSIQAALINGELDAGSLWQPFRYNVAATLKDSSIEMKDTTTYKAYAIIVARGDYLQKHKNETVRFFKALIRAEQYLKKNLKESQQILSKEIAIPLDILKTVWNEYYLKIHMSKELLSSIEKEGKWIVETQSEFEGKGIPNYKEVFALEYLKIVDRKRVKGF